jgi:hypothetical protein
MTATPKHSAPANAFGVAELIVRRLRARMTKYHRDSIFALLVMAVLTAVVCLEHTRSYGFDLFVAGFYLWILAPAAALWLITTQAHRRGLSPPVGLSLLLATVAFALLYAAMFVQVAFFPGSSTDAIGLLFAPGIGAIGAALAGGLTYLICSLRRL